jgi:formylmethanofuran dehydrogenase subunit E
MNAEDEDIERCSRCGDEITDTNTSDRVGDDLCVDCRFEVDSDAEEDETR